MLFLGSLVVASACLPNVYGIYGGVTVFPNLFLFVTAQALAGKVRLSLCCRLVEPIHCQLHETNKLEYEEYKRQQAEYVANKKDSDAENGLFSRFMFYYMNIRLQWIDVFACNEHESLDQRFDCFGEVFFDFCTIKHYQDIRFSLSSSQQSQFTHYFEQIQQQYWELLGNDYVGTIRRLGLITFRVAMILTTLRLIAPPLRGGWEGLLVCSDTDFQIAMEMVKVLLQHAAYVFRQLPQVAQNQTPNTNPRMALFEALPPQFDRTRYIEVASQLQIPESTADKQIARFCKAGLLVR
ncbi:MAG: DUF3987 domain-containing protein [Bacteroidales bacterium]